MNQLAGRLGALAERNFRILFTSTTISAVGDGVSTIALAFAVLQISGSPVALGAVIAGRQVAQAAITLAAGVWSDRLPIPLGSALAGPVAALVGISTTLIGAAVVTAVCIAITVAQPSVWAIRELEPAAEPAAA